MSRPSFGQTLLVQALAVVTGLVAGALLIWVTGGDPLLAYGGLWEGSLYVFDGRESVPVGRDPKVIGRCAVCETPTTRMVNCADDACRNRVVLCAGCGDTVECARHADAAAAVTG